jgi:hypothetical protein
MSINKSNDENIATHTEAYYGELASQEQEYLDEAEEELRAILADDPSPSRNCNSVLTENCGDRELIQTDIRTIQTSDGPENAMFCASSTSRSSVHKGQTQC